MKVEICGVYDPKGRAIYPAMGDDDICQNPVPCEIHADKPQGGIEIDT